MADVLTLDEIAGIFRVTEKAIRGWVAAGMPVKERGTQGGARKQTRISLLKAVEWYFAENFERLELERARTRLADEQSDKLADEKAVRRGELGQIVLWQTELIRFLGELRTALLALPTKVAPRLNGDVNQRKDRLEQAVHELLRTLAAYQSDQAAAQHPAGDQDGREGADAAAEVNGKRVGGPVPMAVKRKQRRARSVEH